MQTEEAVKVSDELIISSAINASLKVEGVHHLTGGLTESLSKNILGKDYGNKGIKLSRNDDGLIIDVYAVVNYQVKIPQLAWEIQDSVKKEIESATHQNVAAVNIHVQGVYLQGEEED